jgi:hypothetical protein
MSRAFFILLCAVMLVGCAAGTSIRGYPSTPTPSPKRSSETPYLPPTMIYQLEGIGEATASYSTRDGITSETYTLSGDTLDVWIGSPTEVGTLILNVLSLEGYNVTCRILVGDDVIAEDSGQVASCQPS